MVDPTEDGVNWYGYCNNCPVAFIDKDGLRIWFVHGTFTKNPETRWYPRFCNNLARFLRDTYIRPHFKWSARNSDRARRTAATKLADEIQNWYHLNRKRKIILVCHSHEGLDFVAAHSIVIDNLNLWRDQVEPRLVR